MDCLFVFRTANDEWVLLIFIGFWMDGGRNLDQIKTQKSEGVRP